MTEDSRTSKSIHNAKVSLFFSVMSMLVGFLSRRFFLDALSSETLGLRVTIGGFLSMLNLAELGIGAAIGVFLYKPLYEKDHKAINEIMSIQGWLYRRVTAIVLLGSIILLFFFPKIFESTTVPSWYPYAIFLVFLFPMLLSYAVNYKATLIIVAQKTYKISTITSSVTLVKALLQMIILFYVENPLGYWLAMEVVDATLSIYIVNRVVYKEYPWLSVEVKRGREYLKKYPNILKRTWQISLHNISGALGAFIPPITISSIASYSQTGNYDNYNNLTTNIRTLTISLFSNLTAAVGDLLAEGDSKKIYSFFWEIQSFVYFVAALGGFVVYMYADQFITFWLGDAYVLSPLLVFLVACLGYVDFCRRAVDSYIASSGLYQDIGTPVVDIVLNIGLSILFGLIIGWEGVLLGSLMNLIVITAIWKPYFIFKNLFQRSGWEYFRNILKFHVMTWSLIFLFKYLVGLLEIRLDTFLLLCLNGAWITMLFAGMIFGLFYATSRGFRGMTARFVLLLRNALASRHKVRPTH